MQRRRHREGEWRCGCAHYRGGNDATGLAFYKLLDGSFPLRPTQLWMPENDKKKKKKKMGVSSLLSEVTHFYFHTFSLLSRGSQMGAWHQLSKGTPPPSSPPPLFILSYADLFMNAPGSGDHIAFTTSGLDFQCSTYTVYWMSEQIPFFFF